MTLFYIQYRIRVVRDERGHKAMKNASMKEVAEENIKLSRAAAEAKQTKGWMGKALGELAQTIADRDTEIAELTGLATYIADLEEAYEALRDITKRKDAEIEELHRYVATAERLRRELEAERAWASRMIGRM